MNRPKRIALLVAATVLLAITLWLLFGWSVYDTKFGIVTVQRFFGRATLLEIDTNRDGHTDSAISYSWWDPYNDSDSRPFHWCDYFVTARRDRNLDGQWDVWATNLGDTGTGRSRRETCQVAYSIDTDLDGTPDFETRAFNECEALDLAGVEECDYIPPPERRVESSEDGVNE